MKTKMKSKKIIMLIPLLILFLISCAAKQKDPLKNTKKLVKKGHVSLYKNGAVRIPNTNVHLIPSGPRPLELAKELSGVRTKQSFMKSIKNAKEAVNLATEGTKQSYRIAKMTNEKAVATADAIKDTMSEKSKHLTRPSSSIGSQIIGKSRRSSKNMLHDGKEIGASVDEIFYRLANGIENTGKEDGEARIENTSSFSKKLSHESYTGFKTSFQSAKKHLIYGYSDVPVKLATNFNNIGKTCGKADIVEICGTENIWRKKWSDQCAGLISETSENYTENIKTSFENAGKEFNEYQLTGIPFATLKATRWVMQGLIWDSLVSPATKFTTGSVGYLGTNCLAFPAKIAIEEGKAITMTTGSTAWNLSKSATQLVSPPLESLFDSTSGIFEITGGNIAAGALASGGYVVGKSEIFLSKGTGLFLKGSGKVTKAGIEYIGIPITALGVTTGGTTTGAALYSVEAITLSSLYVIGEIVSLGTNAMGKAVSGTMLTAGTVFSTAGSAAYGTYELSKAVVVPTGYQVCSGVALSYGTVAHFGAQSVLLVADGAYLVLSLEGPKSVVYLIKSDPDNNVI